MSILYFESLLLPRASLLLDVDFFQNLLVGTLLKVGLTKMTRKLLVDRGPGKHLEDSETLSGQGDELAGFTITRQAVSIDDWTASRRE